MAAPAAPHPAAGEPGGQSITSMVSHLRSSIQDLEGRLSFKSSGIPSEGGARGSMSDGARRSGSLLQADSDVGDLPNFTYTRGAQRRTESNHGEAAEQHELYSGVGKAIASAVTRTMGEARFHSVRDSMNGEVVDAGRRPPARPYAEARNVLTVRRPLLSCAMQELHFLLQSTVACMCAWCCVELDTTTNGHTRPVCTSLRCTLLH